MGVVIAYMFSEHTSGWFTHSLVDLVRYDGLGSRHVVQDPDGGLIMISTGPRVAEARNTIVDKFAEEYPEGAEWLLMLDSDMRFDADLLDKLMAVASPEETPILGGLCFTGGRGHGPQPTIYREVIIKGGEDGEDRSSIQQVTDYPRDALVKVAATGGACLLLHRKALAKMQAEYGTYADGRPNPYPWFAEGVVGHSGEAWGEDVLFCLRARAIGIPVHVLTSVKLGHVKPEVIDEVYFDNYRRAKESDRGAARAAARGA